MIKKKENLKIVESAWFLATEHMGAPIVKKNFLSL